MQLLRKLFFGINMTWLKVIIFAVISGVVTGIIMMIPALDETSLHNIGVTVEAWCFFAMIICSNCKKPLEAMAKTFVFFIISQPLVYLTMWPVYHGFPWHYYMFWFYFTIATIPMAACAWYIRKQNIVSALILAVVCTGMLYMGFWSACVNFYKFPLGLLTTLFCLAQPVVYIAVLLDNKRERLITGIITVIAAISISLVTSPWAPHTSSNFLIDNADDSTYIVADENIVKIEDVSEYDIDVTGTGFGTTTITQTKPDGSTIVYEVTVARQTGITFTTLH